MKKKEKRVNMIVYCLIAFILGYGMITAGIYLCQEEPVKVELTQVFDSKRVLAIVKSF